MNRQISIPTLVRVKLGALDRLGIYMDRHGFRQVVLMVSEGLPGELIRRAHSALEGQGIQCIQQIEVTDASLETAQRIFAEFSPDTKAVIGMGGGKALDIAKYSAFLSRLPYIAVPTSLSNDAFCSPQSSLTLAGKRRSLPSAMPYGIVLDTAVCLEAPEVLWHSGIGDLTSKLTAIRDWKLAYDRSGTLVDDFAALLSDATVYQFIARPGHDLEGIRLLGTALMLNGVAMEIAGTSRPASGSEHLLSHALDQQPPPYYLHGLQVGVATYIISQLQDGTHTDTIATLFDKTGFWQSAQAAGFQRRKWEQAIDLAPGIKHNYTTVLNEPGIRDQYLQILAEDPRLQPLLH